MYIHGYLSEHEITVIHLTFPSTFGIDLFDLIGVQTKIYSATVQISTKSDHFWQMSEQILPCADMCPRNFSPYFILC